MRVGVEFAGEHLAFSPRAAGSTRRKPASPLFQSTRYPRPLLEREGFRASLKINFSLAKHDACAAMTFDDLLKRRRRVA